MAPWDYSCPGLWVGFGEGNSGTSSSNTGEVCAGGGESTPRVRLSGVSTLIGGSGQKVSSSWRSGRISGNASLTQRGFYDLQIFVGLKYPWMVFKHGGTYSQLKNKSKSYCQQRFIQTPNRRIVLTMHVSKKFWTGPFEQTPRSLKIKSRWVRARAP